MIQILSAPEGVRAAEVLLERRLQELLPLTRPHIFGHQGKSFEEEVRTNSNLWCCHRMSGTPQPTRFWNAFGLFDRGNSGNIVVEINFPLSGRDRRIAGAFARAEADEGPLILHRGKVGGGKEGIGQTRFSQWYASTWPQRCVELDDVNGATSQFVLVGTLLSPSFLNDLTQFVEAVFRFKAG